MGLEPTIFGTTNQRFNRLSHTSTFFLTRSRIELLIYTYQMYVLPLNYRPLKIINFFFFKRFELLFLDSQSNVLPKVKLKEIFLLFKLFLKRVGFEPTMYYYNGFTVHRLKPLSHLFKKYTYIYKFNYKKFEHSRIRTHGIILYFAFQEQYLKPLSHVHLIFFLSLKLASIGLEPITISLKGYCSTNWANCNFFILL